MSRRQVGTARAPLEKVEQANIVRLLRSLGAAVYVLGTTRRRTDHHGTMMTAGMCDLVVFMKTRGGVSHQLLLIEVKRTRGGRLSAEQAQFRGLCLQAHVHHIVGGLDVVMAWLVDHQYLRGDQVAHQHAAPAARTASGGR